MPKSGDRFGDFVLVREIGRGAMGVVWAARQESLGREVALKVLGEAYATDPVWVARFKAEAGAAARLSHPGILPVYAVGETGGLPWFAMERVDGENLSERLQSQGKPAWEEIARTVREAALALHHAHEHGVVHRDIKPANLMRRSDGRIVLTDFGLSKRIGSGSLTTTGLLVGTPYYMSPELVAGKAKQVGPGADVYGLGVTLYELMTGGPPFLAENAVALLRHITDDEPEPPSKKDPRVPKDLETIALVCLAKRPEKRYPSAEALAEDLARFLAHEPITRRRAGPGERLARFVARNRLTVGVAVVAALVLVGVGLFFRGELTSQEEGYREQIARLLAQADVVAESGDLEQAREIERQADVLATKSEDAARAHALELAADFLRDLKAGREPSLKSREQVEAWEKSAPAHLTIVADPPTANLEGSRFVGREEHRVTDLALESGDLTAGVWRLRASAPGRLTTMLTVLAPPGSRGRLKVVLPVEDAATAGMVSYGGAWFPAADPAKAASADGLEPHLEPYLLDAERVTLRDYLAFVEAQDVPKRGALAPAPRRGRTRGPAGSETPYATGLTAAQATAYAAWRGKRLPTDAELRNAIGPGRVHTVIARAGKLDGSKEAFERLREAGAAVGRALRSAEGLSGWDARPEWAQLTLGADAAGLGRWPRVAALLADELPGEALPSPEARSAAGSRSGGEERASALRLARSLSRP